VKNKFGQEGMPVGEKPAEEGMSHLSQQLKENVTPSLMSAADQSRCPACGAIITANDELCPSCEIAFVADGSQKWTLGPVGPADGIYRPHTEISE
jgi:hypothetical protein